MNPLLLVALGAGGLWALASLSRPRAPAPTPYRADETADQIWNKFLLQHGSAPSGSVWVPSATDAPSMNEARSSLPASLQVEFDEALASSDGKKAEALLNKLGTGYPEASRVLLRKAST